MFLVVNYESAVIDAAEKEAFLLITGSYSTH